MSINGKLTEAMVKTYVETNGTRCPFCGSLNICAEPFDPDGSLTRIWCEKCGESWMDIMKLVGMRYAGEYIVVRKGD